MKTLVLVLGCLFLLILALREPGESLTDASFRLVTGLVGEEAIGSQQEATAAVELPSNTEIELPEDDPFGEEEELLPLPELEVTELPDFIPPSEMDVVDDSLTTIQALYQEAARLMAQHED